MNVVNVRTAFRELLARDGIIVAPGGYDAFSASLVQQAGFKALYVGGSNIHAVMGYPDGEGTRTEYLGRVREIIDAIGIPALVDIDTGFGSGGVTDLMRTVSECERIGVAAVHCEDQVTDVRIYGYKAAYVVPREEMVKKVEAALEARKDKNLVFIARTDARTRYGLEEALERGKAYAKAGADMVIVNALQTVDELKRAVDYVGVPIAIFNGATKPGDYGNKLTFLNAQQLQDIGVKLVTFANGVRRMAGFAMREVLEEISRTGTDNGFVDRMLTKIECQELVGTSAKEELRQRFSVKSEGEI